MNRYRSPGHVSALTLRYILSSYCDILDGAGSTWHVDRSNVGLQTRLTPVYLTKNCARRSVNYYRSMEVTINYHLIFLFVYSERNIRVSRMNMLRDKCVEMT